MIGVAGTHVTRIATALHGRGAFTYGRRIIRIVG
jgi:hypothetical protein